MDASNVINNVLNKANKLILNGNVSRSSVLAIELWKTEQFHSYLAVNVKTTLVNN